MQWRKPQRSIYAFNINLSLVNRVVYRIYLENTKTHFVFFNVVKKNQENSMYRIYIYIISLMKRDFWNLKEIY